MSIYLSTLAGHATPKPPIWLMRQAGRYLPEYRALRQGVPDFLSFCYNPDLAVEATLQPIRRFGFDAAILFSDILVVPDGLGQKVRFEKGEGPKLEVKPIAELVASLSLERMRAHLAPVYEAVRRLRAELPKDVALIGFSGAPWTLACYMLEGEGSRDWPAIRAAAYAEPKAFSALIQLLTDAVGAHLSAQIEAGAQAVQLFESWVGACPTGLLARGVIAPTEAIVRRLRAHHRSVPVVGFAKGIGSHFSAYAALTGVQGVGVDFMTDLAAVRMATPKKMALQGNLDPELLAHGTPAMVTRWAKQAREVMEGRPYVVNLGHGILPHTPISQVETLIEAVRA